MKRDGTRRNWRFLSSATEFKRPGSDYQKYMVTYTADAASLACFFPGLPRTFGSRHWPVIRLIVLRFRGIDSRWA